MSDNQDMRENQEQQTCQENETEEVKNPAGEMFRNKKPVEWPDTWKKRVLVPEKFYTPAEEQGTLHRIRYISRKYYIKGFPAYEKEAMIYLPYGYEKDGNKRKYNILYLLHGSGGSHESYMGTETEPKQLKHMADHMIQEKIIEPMIFVMPTFTGEGMAEYRAGALTFYIELVYDLIPAVESRYRTFLEEMTAEGIRTSREHRAFGGFSLGSVAGWTVFSEAPGTAKYYLNMCGDCWEFEPFGGRECPEETAAFLSDAAIRSGYSKEDYCIFTAAGTEDSAYEVLPPQVAEMKKHPEAFVYTENDFRDGNLIYYLAEGHKHSYGYTCEYIFNCLPLFFPADSGE